MEFNQIVELIKTVSASELTTFRYEEGNQKILIQSGNVTADGMPMELTERREMNAPVVEAVLTPAQTVQEATVATNDASVVNAVAPQTAPEGKLVKSPLVGRFYVAPSQDAEPFVKVGDTVKKGQTLAIVEAMKLMNEIESEYDGVVAEVLVENEQGVEYGQALFRIV